MGDGAAERGVGGGGRVDVNELLVLGRVGERLNALLFDGDPVGGADVGADLAADLVEGGDGHGLS